MKHLTILIPRYNINIISALGTYMMFKSANAFWTNIGKGPVFDVELAGGLNNDISVYNGLFSVHPQIDIKKITKTDLVIIAALQPEIDYSASINQNKDLIDWISNQYKKGAEIISLCTGAFLLASTGLLNGKMCSTHWSAANEFRHLFPKVNLVTEKIITEEQGIMTSGGAFSFMNFLLYIVEKYYDRETAIFCSKAFEIDMDRTSQSPFEIFRGQKKHNDEAIKKVQTFLENNFSEKINIEKLASDFAMGRRNLDRRFKKAAGNTPFEYLQRLKVEAAKKSFESTQKSIKEVMYDVGYCDFKAFRTTFRKITGFSPLQYRNKYNNGTAIQ